MAHNDIHWGILFFFVIIISELPLSLEFQYQRLNEQVPGPHLNIVIFDLTQEELQWS